ncbi:MORN repeat-containing protein [Roseococcus pinisoli]|uniref:MORN repeat protein n=1 Tax=Roseococcus pinisoli TaxID=2835040 RepID=A0ABS5QAK8_9PROT|nr:hypothetical protein [Roseococcus pinisoli]MBS7810700.1 hypothetical protein [Roseococcus pinisoli]
MRWCFLVLALASTPLAGALAQTGAPPGAAPGAPSVAPPGSDSGTTPQRPAPPPADSIAAVGKPGWTVDAENGCWVWNPNPQQEETVRWTGPCPEGPSQGEGVLAWRYVREGQPGDERYVGTMARGRMHGIGTYLESTGEVYQGEFQDGREQGRGLRVFPTGRYDGEWRQGQRHGRGVMFWINGNLFRGEFRNGLPEGPGEYYSVEDGWFRGDWQAGCLRDGNRVAALGKPIEVCRDATEG